MTETTDIAALNRPVRDRYDWSNAVWRDCDQCGKQHTGTVTAEDGSQICAHCADQLYWSAWQVLAERALDKFKAERQQREAAEKEVSYWCNLNARRNEEVSELREKLANPVVLPAGYAVRAGHPINEAERNVMIPKEDGNWLSRFDVEHAICIAGYLVKEK